MNTPAPNILPRTPMRRALNAFITLVALAATPVLAAEASRCGQGELLDPSELLARMQVSYQKNPASQALASDIALIRQTIAVHADIAKVSDSKPKLLIADTPIVNACADAENGSIVVFRGLMRMIGSDRDALAAVIGHEYAHLSRKHSASIRVAVSNLNHRYRQAWATSRGFDERALAAQLTGQLFAYKREQERDADDLGIQLMSKAGFDPGGFKRLASQMFALSGGKEEKAGLLATHPGWLERSIGSDTRIADEVFEQRASSSVRDEDLERLRGTVDEWLGVLPDSGKAWYYKGVIQRQMRSMKSVAAFEKAFSANKPPINTGEPRFEEAWLFMCTGLFREGHRYESMWCAKKLPTEAFERYAAKTGQSAVIVVGNDPQDLKLEFERAPDGRKVIRYDAGSPTPKPTPAWKAVRFE